MNRGIGLLAVVCALLIGLGLYIYSIGIFLSWGSRGGTADILSADGGTMARYWYQQLIRGDRVYLALALAGDNQLRPEALRALNGGNPVVIRGTGNGESEDLLSTEDGRAIFWSSSTRTGRTGKVIIDGQKFDFARGAFFLVSTKNKRTRVDQLAVDPELLSLVSDPEKFAKMVTADPRIAAFLKSLPTEKIRR